MSATAKRHIAVIPAKARSTRFPGKNSALLAGKPLVARCVNAARQSELFDTIMVSTDDAAIAQIARDAGADVPFFRDASLTQDHVEAPAVVRQAVEWYRQNRQQTFGWVCILQPTCPLRTPQDIIDSHRRITTIPDADAVVSVSRYHHHPRWALKMENDRLVPDSPQSVTTSRQNLPDLYHPDGVVYWWRVAALMTALNLNDGKVIPYFTPRSSALDIDYPEDLLYAEWRMKP